MGDRGNVKIKLTCPTNFIWNKVYCNIDAKYMHYGKKAPTIHHYLAHLKEEKLITRYRLS